MADNGIQNTSDTGTGETIKKPGPDNPGFTNTKSGGGGGVSGGISGGGKGEIAFLEEKHIFNNQTIKQKAPKITKKEVKYAKPPHVAADDAKKLSDVREKFAKNADKPTTASDNDGKKLPEIMENIDPQQLMQMLPQMFKKMSKVRDQMNISVPAASKNIFQDAFTGALRILVSRYGYDEVIFVFNRMLGNEGYNGIIPEYRDIVRNGFVRLITEVIQQGPNIQVSPYETVTYGKIIPSPLVSRDEVPELYTRVYYPADEDPHPGYNEWISPQDDTLIRKVVFVRMSADAIPASSASEEAYNDAERGVADALSPYIEDGFDDFNPKILTVAILNSILVNQINYLTENGENNTAGNGAGGGGGGGGGKGNMLQQLLGKLQPLVEKFQQQMLGQQGGGSKLSDGRVGLGVETILDVMKNKDALEKFTKNMGNLNGMEKNAEGAFSMNNMNGLSNLQGQLGQFMNQSGGGGGGGGGGGSGGGGSGSGGSSSGSSSPLSYQQLSNTTKLLNNLNPTNTTTA
jgi:hypothetical protein